MCAFISFWSGIIIIWGSCWHARMTLSIDRPGKGIERGRCTRCGRAPACPCARSRRASLASKWATEASRSAVPGVLRALLHIFPTQNCHFLQKSPNLALKRNAKRPFWPQTYIFPMKNQHFWWKNATFSMGGLVLVFGWSWGGLGLMKGRWRIDEGINEGSMKDRWIKSKKQTKKENKKNKEATLYKQIRQLPIARPRRLLCYLW